MSNDIISAYTIPFFERELMLYEVLGMLDFIIFFKILAEVQENQFFFLTYLKALVVKISVLHDFGFGKVSQIHETYLMELQLFC